MGRTPDPQERFRALFEANYEAVRRYVLRRHREGADDIVAETFVVAWRRLDQVPANAAPWLLAVARKVVANQLRRDGRNRALIDRLALDAQSCGASDTERAGTVSPDLATALLKLSQRELEALLLTTWDELTPQEAAVVVGCSSASFRVRLHRARRKVATELTSPVDVVPEHLISKESL